MGRKRRTFDAKFKAKVALEAIKEVSACTELAARYQIHPNLIVQWKKRLIEESVEVFSRKQTKTKATEEELTAPLYEEIGRLKMDLKWLKKKL